MLFEQDMFFQVKLDPRSLGDWARLAGSSASIFLPVKAAVALHVCRSKRQL